MFLEVSLKLLEGFGVTFKIGIIGVWIAMSIDELARALIFIIRFKKEKWAKIDLVEY